jgi:hypothetical protein
MSMQITVLGIDLGKNSCSLIGLDEVGAVIAAEHRRFHAILASMHRRDGSLLRCAPSRPAA